MSEILRFHRSIRFQMAALFSAVFLLVELLAGGYLYERMRLVLIETDDQALANRASTLADKVRVSPVIVPLPNPGEWLRIDYQSERFTQNLYTSPGFPRISSTDTGTFVREVAGLRLMVLDHPLNADESEWVRISLAHSSRELNANLRTIGFVLVLTIVMSITVASVLSYRLASVALRPIRQVIRQAQTVNHAGRFDYLPVSATGDEVQELTMTLNAMFERISRNLTIQNNFFASASHELRTPLTIMQTEVEVNLKKESVNTEAYAFMSSQLQEIQRLRRLLEDFLLVSEWKNNELAVELAIQPLDDLLLDSLDRCGPLLRESGVRLHVSIEPTFEHYQIVCDAGKLVNIFINLLENATKYAPRDTLITVCLGKGSGAYTYVVSFRNQIREPFPELEKISAPFYQADPLQKGYGLGLWISRQLVQRQGGDMQLEQTPGEFCVRLSFKAVLP